MPEVKAYIVNQKGLTQEELISQMLLVSSAYNFANFDASSDPIYLGYLDKDGKYYIQKITTSTGVILYSAGTSGYSGAWSDRATQAYNPYNEEF